MRERVPQVASEQLSWPQDVSHEPTLKIGEVATRLRQHFPHLSNSKIRYFEDVGLIAPYRTAANQRIFSLADVERLRFILVEQRDRYLRLPQIKEMLRQLDTGLAKAEHPGKMRILDTDEVRPSPQTRLQKGELASLTGASLEEIEQLIEADILQVDARGRLTSHSLEIVKCCSMLAAAGMDLRSLRQVRNSANAHSANVLAQLQQGSNGTPLAKDRIANEAGELAALVTNLYRGLLAESIEVRLR